MLKSTPQLNNKAHHKRRSRSLNLLCKVAAKLIDQLYHPIDATNRFINLALQSVEEDSQGRQFLIESKKGLRKTSALLKRLINYTRRIEKEARKISSDNEQGPPISS